MKKIIIAMAAIAAALSMTSCNKEQLIEQENNTIATEGTCIVTASAESSFTKTSLSGNDTDGYEVFWSEGDTFKLAGNTFTLIKGSGTASGIFQGNAPKINGGHTAFYPASYDGFNWPLEQTYTEGNITGSPMTADVYCYKGEISGGKVEFKNKGGILRLAVKGSSSVSVKSILVCTDDTPNITLDCGDGVDLNSTDGVVFHIAMPIGTHSGTSILFSTSDGKYCIKKLKSDLVINRSEITPASIKIEKWSSNIQAPEGALSESFTVSSDGTKVFFSKGNLYWDNSSFQFESSQLSSATEWNSSHISHFYWSNDAGKACTQYYSDPDASQNDVFFTNATYTTPNPSFTANGQTGMWRALSKDEWKYLIDNNGAVWSTVNGVNGLIIFCDGYSGSKTGLTEIPDGCAFLPAVGYRNGYSGMISEAGSAGAYSSSVAGYSEGDPTPCAYDLVFGENYTSPQALNYRVRYGCSVRLVTEKSGQSTPSFTVTFDANGHGTAPASIAVPYHTTITTIPTDPITDGYNFWGWYKDKTCTEEWDFAKDVVTSDITLYALWYMDGTLFGSFTVDDKGKKVCFSKGNLWRDDDGSFHFEDNQYDFKSGDYNTSHVSHFMWSKDAEVAWPLKYNDTSASESDVFFTNATQTTPNPNFAVDGQKGVWRMLSGDEWSYLINHNGCSKITIAGVYGMIVFRDGYSGSRTDLTEIPKGCLFLPAADVRNGNAGETSTISGSSNGYYWSSSSCGDDRAYFMYFTKYDVIPSSNSKRYRAFSVRLVIDVE